MSKEKYSLGDCKLGSAEHCHIFAMLNLELASVWLRSHIKNYGNPSIQDRLESDASKEWMAAVQAFMTHGAEIPPEDAKRLLAYFEGEKRRLVQQKFEASMPGPPLQHN